MSTDLPFLDAYGGQSTDDLIAMSENYRIDSIVLAFEMALDGKAKPSKPERVVLAVEAIEREVNNGGFLQFFVNSSLEYTKDIVEAFRLIGCPATAGLCQKAIDLLGVQDLTDLDAIEAASFEVDDDQSRVEQFNALDDEYYAGAEEPIAVKLFEYIKQNRHKISL